MPLPPVSPGERSYEQVREEVLKLQTALNEREAEISQLESTIQQLRTPTIASTSPFLTSTSASPDVSPLVSVNIEHPTTPPSTAFDDEDDGIISPHTTASFSSLKANTNAHDPDVTGLGLLPLDPSSTSPSSSTSSPSVNQTAVLDDLMRSMAQKESSHREAIDVLEGQLVTLQRQHDELTVLSRDQVVNMMSEVEQLRSALEERPEKGVLDEKLRVIEEQVQLKEVEIEEERRRPVESVETAKRELLEGTLLSFLISFLRLTAFAQNTNESSSLLSLSTSRLSNNSVTSTLKLSASRRLSTSKRSDKPRPLVASSKEPSSVSKPNSWPCRPPEKTTSPPPSTSFARSTPPSLLSVKPSLRARRNVFGRSTAASSRTETIRTLKSLRSFRRSTTALSPTPPRLTNQ